MTALAETTPPAPVAPPPAARGHAGRLGLVLGATALAWVAALAWWWMLPPSRTVDFTIPAGTAAAVAAGQSPPGLPQSLMVRVGDSLQVRNLDGAPHRIGPLWVPPGAEERTAVGPAFFATAALICSIHPSGALSVVPRARPGIAITIPIAAAAGVPMIVAVLVATAIAGNLDSARAQDDPERAAQESLTG